MVLSAANCNCVFLQRTHTRQCLSCINNRSLCSLNKLYSFVCSCCNTAHVLNKVQSCTLALEDCSCFSVNLGYDVALFENVSVLFENFRFEVRL